MPPVVNCLHMKEDYVTICEMKASKASWRYFFYKKINENGEF